MKNNRETIYQLFERNELEIAILGNEDFFLKDSTWANHDNLSIFLIYLDWLRGYKEKFLSIVAMKKVISELFINNSEVNNIDNGLKSIGIIRSYCIAAKEKDFWPLKKDFFVDLIAINIKQFSTQDVKRLNIKQDIDSLRKYLPDLPTNELLFKCT